MNEKRFCHSCGQQIGYVKFCPHCGTSQESLAATPPPPQPAQQPRQQTRVPISFRPRILGGNTDEDEELNVDRVNSVDELGLTFAEERFGIEESNYPIQPYKEKIGDIIVRDGTLAPTPLQPRDVLGSTNLDPKTIREEFKREAGGTPTVTLGEGIVAPSSRVHIQSRKDS